MLWRWAIRRHPEKSAKWVRKKYFRTKSYRNWVFSSKVKDKDGNDTYLDLVEISKTPIRRHIKIKAEATPYNPGYKEYLADRSGQRQPWLPSAHRTVLTGPYTAPHVSDIHLLTSNQCPCFSVDFITCFTSFMNQAFG